MEEEWRPVLGYEGFYEVSNLGRVKSILREEVVIGRWWKPVTRTRKERILKTTINKLGYEQVGLHKHSSCKLLLVHRLVAFAFIKGYDLCTLEVNHINGDKSNNRIDNLEWVTRYQNSIHSTRVLKKNRGNDNAMSILDEERVKEILTLYETGLNQTELGVMFNVTNHTIHKIIKRINWAHVSREFDAGKEVGYHGQTTN